MTIQAILVDPFARTVSTVQVDPKAAYNEVRRIINAQTLDVVQAGDYFGGSGGAFLYVDDEGLLIEPEHQAYSLVGSKPIAGKFLVMREAQTLGDDDEEDGGFLVDVDFTAADVLCEVTFCNAKFAFTAVEMGVQAAAAAFASRGLHVEQPGNGVLFVTPHQPD